MAQKKKTSQRSKVTEGTRVRKLPNYKSFKLSKKIKNHVEPLPGIYKLFKECFRLLFNNKKLFFGITVVYAVLTWVLVSGVSLTSDFSQAKISFSEVFNEKFAGVNTALALFSFLISSGNQSQSDTGDVYRVFLTLITVLVLIWAIRQVYAGEKPTVKQSFYQGVYPMIPFLLVALVFCLQLIPFAIGSFLTSTVFGTDIAVTFAEKLIWIVILLLLTTLSLYMIISSLMAFFIVTLPDMMPMKALRSARGLVMHRRISIALRLVGFPIVSLLLFFIILYPVILFLPFLAVPLFVILSGLVTFMFIAYTYNLYRALLK